MCVNILKENTLSSFRVAGTMKIEVPYNTLVNTLSYIVVARKITRKLLSVVSGRQRMKYGAQPFLNPSCRTTEDYESRRQLHITATHQTSLPPQHPADLVYSPNPDRFICESLDCACVKLIHS